MLQQLVNFLVLGGVYAITALGFTLYFGAVNLVNFAHGDICTLAAFLFLLLLPVCGMDAKAISAPEFVAIAGVATLLCVLVGVLSERVLFRPLRQRHVLEGLIVSVGLSMCLREVILHFYPNGGNPQFFPDPFHQGTFHIGQVSLTEAQVAMLVTLGVLTAAFYWLVRRTQFGRSMRALAQDPEAAMMIGLPVNRIVVAAFALGSAFAAVAGITSGALYGSVRFDMGLSLGVKGFVAAVAGGLRNPNGALLGGLLLAFIETAIVAFLPAGSSYRDIGACVLLLSILAFRPTGILGGKNGAA